MNEGSFEFLLLSELSAGTWIATGLADDLARLMSAQDARGLPVPYPGVQLRNMDELLAKIVSAHQAALATIAAFRRFLAVAFA